MIIYWGHCHFEVSYPTWSWDIKTRKGGYEALAENRDHHKDYRDLTQLDKVKLHICQLEAELKDKELMEGFEKILELQHKEWSNNIDRPTG